MKEHQMKKAKKRGPKARVPGAKMVVIAIGVTEKERRRFKKAAKTDGASVSAIARKFLTEWANDTLVG